MIFTLGINHHSAPLAIRERVAFGADKLGHALADLTRERPVREVAILSTCNRTEIYCAAESPDVVIDWLAHYHQVPRDELAPYVYTHNQPEAIGQKANTALPETGIVCRQRSTLWWQTNRISCR